MGLAVTAVFSWLAHQSALESHRISEASLEIAQSTHGLNLSSAERELASRVYIGATPVEISADDEISDVAVVNVSPVDMYEVVLEGVAFRVEYPNENSIVPPAYSHWPEKLPLRTFQACTGYAIPANFELERMYFFDGSVHWVRHRDGRLEKSDTPGPTAEDLEYSNLFGSEPYEPSSPRETYTFDASSCS